MTTQEEQEPSRNIVKMIVSKVLAMLSEEINKQDTQSLIKQKIIVPVINMIYTELYPYIIALIVTIIIILVLSLLTFIAFILYYLRNL
jgi:hypothetical protein